MVNVTLLVAAAILTESALSFLGFGIQPPTPSWGNLLANAQSQIFTAPWLIYFPGLFILITVLCVNFLGDGLRDALDPHGKISEVVSPERGAPHDRADPRSRTLRSTSPQTTAWSRPSTACRLSISPGETLGVVGESGSGQERHLPDRHGAGDQEGSPHRRAKSSSRARTY